MAAKPPVFIVGSPRSGTSLLRNILNRHPALAICGETHFYHYIYTRQRAFGDLGDLRNRRRLVEEYLALRRIQRLGMDHAGLSEWLLREATSYQALFTSLLEYYAHSQGKTRYGEKTPQHALFTEVLCGWFPGAAILHLIRDPRDVAASLREKPWAANHVVANARVWLHNNRAAMRSRHQPGYLLVHYESLVNHPERELARICGHLGEEYCAGALEPPVRSTTGRSRPSRGPVTTERMGRWRDVLTVREVSLVERIAGDEMTGYGYDRTAQLPSAASILLGLASEALDGFRRRLRQIPGIVFYLMRPTKLAREEFWIHHRGWREDEKARTAQLSSSAGSRS